MHVYQDNVFVSNIDVVLNKWKSDFSALYDKPDNINQEFDQDFYDEVINQTSLRKSEMSHLRYDSNSMLNIQLSFDDVVNITQNRKC